jgi:dTDP-4-amino-4,6-dideoxygalactose transaminase
MIPQTDPKASYLAHKPAIDAALHRALDSGWYILGEEVRRFETAFANWLGAAHAIGVASGTDAIELALRACGIAPGDGVFTVTHTAVATVVGIERAGAIPIAVDIDPLTYTMSPQSLEQALQAVSGEAAGLRPRAVVVVHLYGHPADMAEISRLASRHGLAVIEDCAQSHGAAVDGRKTGTLGQAAAFSFYPTKNLGAIGDGGAVVTNDATVAERCRTLREYGWRQRYVSDEPGLNSRLDELQAALLGAKLPSLDRENARRRQIAARYQAALNEAGLGLPTVAARCTHVYHQYVVRSSRRDDLRQFLKEQGVGTLIHYPMPVHQQPAYRARMPVPVSMSHTEQAAREVLSLPMFPELTEQQVDTVIAAAKAWTARGRA